MLETLKQGIQQLIAAYEKEKVERQRLQSALEQSLANEETYRKQIIELERQIDNHKLAGAFLNGNNAESKKKVDKLIKEIDKCISLMEG